MSILGQVIRNFPASLPGPEKLAILECTYNLGLRMMHVSLRNLGEIAAKMSEDILRGVSQNPDRAEDVRKEHGKAVKIVNFVAELTTLTLVKYISYSVGLADLEDAYDATLKRLGQNPATSLIDLSLRLDHMRGFPESDIKELHRSLAGKPFADRILLGLVIYHIMVFGVDNRMRQSMEKEFNLKKNMPLLLTTKARSGV